MFNRPKPKSKLQLEIDKLVNALDDHKVTSPEYGQILDRLKELHKMQCDNTPATVSPDTKVMAAVNLAGIAMIVRHEHLNVIASKAISFIAKLR